MQRPSTTALLITLVLLASIALAFDSHLLRLKTHLSGDAGPAATALWHVWWPQFSVRQSDGMVINAFSGAPFLASHLRDMPILQSALFGVLVTIIGHPILAFNLILILSQVATQLFAFRFLRSKGLLVFPALLGGTIFALSTWYYANLQQAGVIEASLWLLPLTLMAWDGWLAKPTTGRAALVVGSLYLAVLSGMQHLAWMVSLWLPYASWSGRQWWRSGAASEDKNPGKDQLWMMAMLLALLLLIYPTPILVRTLQGNEPAFATALARASTESLFDTLMNSGTAVWLLVAATVLFGSRTAEANFWLIAGGFSLIFAIGLIPEPLRLLSGAFALPFLPLYETEFLLGPALFAMITYVGLGWRNRWALAAGGPRKGLLVGGILALTLVANPRLLGQHRSHPVVTYPFYEDIASEPEDYLVLTYPFGLSNTLDRESTGSDEGAYLFRYAVWHDKRTVSGIAPYYEPAVHEQLASASFLHPETWASGSLEETAEELDVAVHEWRIGYVVVHADLLGEDMVAMVDLVAEESGALCPPVRQDGLVIYRAKWHPDGCEG